MTTDNDPYIEFSGGGFMPFYSYHLRVGKEKFYLLRDLDSDKARQFAKRKATIMLTSILPEFKGELDFKAGEIMF